MSKIIKITNQLFQVPLTEILVDAKQVTTLTSNL